MSGFLWRRLSADDEGISLVEVLVGIMIIGIALTAFASTLTTALSTITRDEQMVRATQLAADELEALRSLDWEDVGFYSDDDGLASAPADTVILGPARNGAPGPERHRPPINRDGIAYTAVTDIIWVDDPAIPAPPAIDPDPQDYKELRITLTWTVRDREFTTEARSTRTPTVGEVPVDPPPPCDPATDPIIDFRISPQPVQIFPVSHNTAERLVIVVEMCEDTAATALLDAGPLGTHNMTQLNPRTFRTEISAGSPSTSGPGTYPWQVTVVGIAVAEQDVVFAEPDTGALIVVDVTTDPAVFCIRSNRRLEDPVTLRLAVFGADPNPAGNVVSFTFSTNEGASSSEQVSGSYQGLDGNGNQVWEAQIPTTVSFGGGSDQARASTVVGQVTRTVDGVQAAGNITREVQNIGTGSCAP